MIRLARINILFLMVLTACTSPQPTPTPRLTAASPSKVPLSTKPASPELVSGCTPTFSELSEDIVYVRGIDPDMGIELMEAADFSQDGTPDLLITRIVFQTQINSPIAILLNDGSGRMRDATSELFPEGIPALHHPTEILIEDYNLDGIPDAYIADEGMDKHPFPGNHNTLILSRLDGTFYDASANLPRQSDESHSAAAADIDMDGDIDLFVGNLGGDGVQSYLLINNGSGSFTLNQSSLAPALFDHFKNFITSSRFADLDQDGDSDLILGQAAAGQPSYIYLNDGSGNFNDPPLSLPPTPLGDDVVALDIDPLDLDGDGWLDLVLVYTTNAYEGRYIQFLLNDQAGGFEDQTKQRITQSTEGAWLRFTILGDINQDGSTDLIFAPIASLPQMQLNDGEGNFAAARFNFDLYNFALADFNGDGLLDLMNSGSPYAGIPEFHATFINQGCP